MQIQWIMKDKLQSSRKDKTKKKLNRLKMIGLTYEKNLEYLL